VQLIFEDTQNEADVRIVFMKLTPQRHIRTLLTLPDSAAYLWPSSFDLAVPSLKSFLDLRSGGRLPSALAAAAAVMPPSNMMTPILNFMIIFRFGFSIQYE
jgi:hypothetical protein